MELHWILSLLHEQVKSRVQEAPEPSAEAGQTDVGLPNPAIGSQPLGPIVAQRDAVELAASRQGFDMMVEEQNRSRPVLEPSERPNKQSRLSAPQQNVMRCGDGT